MSKELYVEQTPANLEIKRFSCVLDSPSQCYKFYWLEAILQLMKKTGRLEYRFEEIIDRMITNAWYTVTMYHLHLGPGRIDNEYSDKVEEAVIRLKKAAPGLSETAKRDEILEALHTHEKEIFSSKNELTKNVPYRLLSPFLKVTSKDWYSKDRIIGMIEEQSCSLIMPYTIKNEKRPLDCKIKINPEWAEWMMKEYPVIIDWLNYNKVIFLQGRNPEVPGIIYKLEPPGIRKLDDVKNLWKAVLERTPVMDIYTNRLINDERYDIDHFVPWSYVAMDEVWNLIPADKSANSSKNNRLPVWEQYSKPYLDTQFLLYKQIFSKDAVYSLFEKCQKHNLSSRWASEQLYVYGRDEKEFKGILEKNLKRTYDAAVIQGYSMWSHSNLQES